MVGVHQWFERPGFSTRLSDTKDSKMALDASLINSQHYKVRINVKWSNLGIGVAPSFTPRCCRY